VVLQAVLVTAIAEAHVLKVGAGDTAARPNACCAARNNVFRVHG
jgi:hypothetical protein